MFRIQKTDALDQDAIQLLDELNETLLSITGSSGADSFCAADAENARGAFLIGYLDGKPIACGALREISVDTAEIKRVYSRKNSVGAAHQIVQALETQARQNGLATIVLETRTINAKAVSFYLSNGYDYCPHYGKYVGRTDAVCFAKRL